MAAGEEDRGRGRPRNMGREPGREHELMQRLAYNGTMQRQLAMYQQYALALTQKYEPDKAGALMESITGRAAPGGKTAKKAAKLKGKESGRMERARSSAYNAALPGGGR